MSVPEDKAKEFREDPQRLIGTRWVSRRYHSNGSGLIQIMEVVILREHDVLLVSLFTSQLSKVFLTVDQLLSEFSCFTYCGTSQEMDWIESGARIVHQRSSNLVYVIDHILGSSVGYNSMGIYDPMSQQMLRSGLSGSDAYHTFSQDWRQATSEDIQMYLEELRRRQPRAIPQQQSVESKIETQVPETWGRLMAWDILDLEDPFDG